MDDDRRPSRSVIARPPKLRFWWKAGWIGFLLALLAVPWELQAQNNKRKKGTSRRKTPSRAVQRVAQPPATPPANMRFQQIEDAEAINLKAEGAVVLDGFAGSVIYEKNGYQMLYPASSTKVLTALLVIEAGQLDKEVLILPEDTKVEPTSIGFKAGETFTRRQLLYALMLKSANDVAHALGRDNAGSVPAFAEKMTARAHELGATSSRFQNPHGLHHPDHYSTPYDMALISRAAMQLPVFRDIVGTEHYNWLSPRGVMPLRNSNKLLVSFEGCTGGKTGYTRAARHVLVCAALRDGHEMISVVMRSDKAGKWTDSSQLLSYALLHPAAMPGLLDEAGPALHPEAGETAPEAAASQPKAVLR